MEKGAADDGAAEAGAIGVLAAALKPLAEIMRVNSPGPESTGGAGISGAIGAGSATRAVSDSLGSIG
jgi:hypothetical protein